MLIVAGHLILDPADRDEHVRSSASAVRIARAAPGCLDFAVSADPVDQARVNVFERWESAESLHAFRNAPTDEEPFDFSRIQHFAIQEFEIRD